MGLFDMFKKKDAAPSFPVVLAADAAGAFVKMEDIPDEVFAQGILGQGCGIDPSEGKVYAPCDGEITQAPDTLHAFGITTPGGVEVLIHVGVDTVEMKGDGFESKVKLGSKVTKGQLLLTMDLDKIKAAGHPAVVITVVTNTDDFASVDVSFISLTKILIPARNLLKTGGQMVCLIKPQFEAGRGKVGKNGVVREPQIHEEVIRKIIDYADSIGFEVLHLEYSPIKGPEGNIEYLLHIRKPEEISEEKLALTEHEAESALQTIIEEKTGLSYTPEWDAVIKGIVDNSHTL